MFQQLRIQNFRSIRDTGDLHLAPLTILIGANNSGKSSILSTLLLLKQSIQDVNPGTGLVTSGPLVDVGSYFDLLPTGRAGAQMQICFKLDREIVKEHLNPRPFMGRVAETPNFDQFELSFGYDPAENNIEVVSAVLTESGATNRLSLVKDKGKWTVSGLREGVGDYVKVSTRAFLPTLATTRTKPPEDLIQPVLDATYETQMRAHGLQHIFENIRYVGPVRERIPRYAILGATSASELMPSGQNLMRVLAATRRLPDRRKRLIDVLGNWLDRQFKLFEQLRLRKFDRAGTVRALVAIDRASGRQINVAATGSGVSQIVPVVVQTVLTPPRGCLIVEQPEVHLHPAAQTTLADLFIENLTHGRQYIIETHSEHFLLRVRRRIADKILKPDSVRVLAVEKKEGWTSVRQLELGDNGHFKDWPDGFFDEGYQEALALAVAQTRRRNG